MSRPSKLNKARTVTVTDAATLVSDATEPWAMRRFRNTSGATSVFFGDKDVTNSGADKGQELKAGEIIEIRETQDRIYMIAPALGSIDISVIEIG